MAAAQSIDGRDDGQIGAMRIALPTGKNHGWGICGESLTREIVKLPNIPEDVTLHAISGPEFYSAYPQMWNKLNFGICFIEEPRAAKPHIYRANRYDGIIAGSEWNADWLKRYGVQNVSYFTQGVDHNFFQSQRRERDGRFIVFSGGKAEYRKGTDIVIRAMKLFMDRHPDVWLSTSWENLFRSSLETLSESGIEFKRGSNCRDTLLLTLAANGIDTDRVLLHPLLEHRCMAGIYHDSDVGLFPNRCEAGNNLVLTEYMAAGRAVIATAGTGHLDVLPQDDTQRLERLHTDVNGWPVPRVFEILDKLEHFYWSDHDPGEENAAWSKQFTWKRAASEIHNSIKWWLEHDRTRSANSGRVSGDAEEISLS